jgi:hypothetical protein
MISEDVLIGASRVLFKLKIADANLIRRLQIRQIKLLIQEIKSIQTI